MKKTFNIFFILSAFFIVYAEGKTVTDNIRITGGGVIEAEGSTNDAFETQLQFTDPTADRVIIFPDAGGTVQLSGCNSTIYNSDGSLTANRVLTGSNNSLSFCGLSSFDLTTNTGDITLNAGTVCGNNNFILNASNLTIDACGIDSASITFPASSTGLLTGGVLSTGAASNQYSISDGTGQIVDASGNKTLVSWTDKTNIVPANIATQLITFVGIDINGNVVEQSGRFTNEQSRSIIALGVAVHVNLVDVDVVNNEQHTAYNTGNKLHDLIEAIGFFNVSGNEFSPNGANLLLNKSAGDMHGVGVNYANNTNNPNTLTLPQLTGLTFQYRFSDGSNGVTGTAIDPDNLDDGAGGLTAVGNNRWSIQRIYSFTSNNVKIQRGVADYPTLEAAIAAINTEAFVTEPSIAANGLLRGFLLVRKGATALNDATQASFISAPKFQGGSGAAGSSTVDLQTSYDNSTNPEITTDSTLGAVQIRRGSAADTDDVLVVENGAGTPVFSATGQGSLTIGGASSITDATNATSAATGALVVTGGAGIGSDLWVGNNTFICGNKIRMNAVNNGIPNTVNSDLQTYDSAGNVSDIIALNNSTDNLIIGSSSACSAQNGIVFHDGSGFQHSIMTQTYVEFNSANQNRDFRVGKCGSGCAIDFDAGLCQLDICTTLYASEGVNLYNTSSSAGGVNVRADTVSGCWGRLDLIGDSQTTSTSLVIYQNGAGGGFIDNRTGSIQVSAENGANAMTVEDTRVRFDQFLSLGGTEAKTIASGAFTATGSYVTLDTEASASSDNLDSINGGENGDLVFIRTTASARDVVLKHNTGNLRIDGQSDLTLNNTNDLAVFVRKSASIWVMVSFTNAGN